MTRKLKMTVLAAGLVTMLCGSAFAGGKKAAQHVAVGTITSIDSNQVVVNEKVKGKEQPMTFQLDSSTQKSGSLNNGTLVTVLYHTQNKQNIASSIRERADTSPAKKSAKKGS